MTRASPELLMLLQHERALLDQIFGKASYTIESSDPYRASVRSSALRMTFGYDPRDASLKSDLGINGPWGDEIAETPHWLRYMDEETAPLRRDAGGLAYLTATDQLRAELRLAARVATEIFSNVQKTLEAVSYVRGYRKAYNDWARGAWK